MSIIKAYRAESAPSTPGATGAEGSTLTAILNGKDSALFGKMLESEGVDPRLLKRLANGSLDATDINSLEDYRRLYNDRMRRSEEVKSFLTQGQISDLVRTNPEFATISNLVGPSKVREIVVSQLSALALTNPSRFDTIADKLSDIRNVESIQSTLDNDIGKIIKEHNLDQTKVAKIFTITDNVQRIEAFTQLVKESSKVIGKWWGRHDKAVAVATNLANSKSIIDSSIGLMKDRLDEMGGVLATDINSDPDMRDAMARTLIGERTEKNDATASFAELKRSIPTDEDFEGGWEEFKSGKAGWESLTDTDKEAARNDYAAAYKDRLKDKTSAKRGVWATVFRTLFSFDVDTKKTKLKL